MTIGRATNGFLTIKFNDTQLIRMGQGMILLGILIVLFSFNNTMSLLGLVTIGVGSELSGGVVVPNLEKISLSSACISNDHV